MAQFLPAWELTSVNEGFYSNNPNDPGLRTYMGISQVHFPICPIWPLIMNWILQHGEPANNHRFTDIPGLDELVEQFYITNFWNSIQGDDIINQDTANTLFDSSVNLGIHEAIVLTQRALSITETGHMDQTTLDSLNIANLYA